MELPRVEDLKPEERKSRVHIVPEDKSPYPEFYYSPLEDVLRFASSIPVPPTEESEREWGFTNWNPVHRGYDDWGVPCESDEEGMSFMMRIMSTQMMYGHWSSHKLEQPGVQMKQLFAAPTARALTSRSATPEHRDLQQKIFVMKYSLAPFMTSFETEYEARCADENVRVWRLITCYGETKLDTLHDRILGPAMGWTRHYHSYKFIIPTNGAYFGPKESTAVDTMHTFTQEKYMLDSSKYQLCHVLREPGQRLVYVYDLGDHWTHNIELIQVANYGDKLEMPEDKQVAKMVKQRYGSKMPQLNGVHLLAGELSCAPEDSNGCNGMGEYGNILKKGPRYYSDEAASSMNWQENDVDNAFDFNLKEHAERLAAAISGKSSAKTGQKVFNIPLRPNDKNDPLFGQPKKPGQKITEQCMGNCLTGCAPLQETIKTRPDKASEAVCAKCGRQPAKEKGKKTPLLRCGSCKGSWYCGRDCQRADWKNHKAKCKAMKKELAAYKEEKIQSKRDEEETVE